MSGKIGRNEPCTCGSGQKYKHCCGKAGAAPEAPADSHHGAVERAVAWLALHHRKGFVTAIEEAIDAAVVDCFGGDEQAAAETMSELEPELWRQLQLNLTEWLLAEGDVRVKHGYQRVADLLLGARGPLLSVGQRAWLAQLARQPLRLYDVTDVVPGSGITLCDAIDPAQAPIAVTEREGSRAMHPGQMIGARVMAVGDGQQLSGAVYPFSMLAGPRLQQRLHDLAAQPSHHAEDDAMRVGQAIIATWLAQYVQPPTLPDFVHAASGEALLFTTDHYQVHDWEALAAALARQADVEGDGERGWSRLVEGADGATRSQATVVPQAGGERISLQYQTAGLAEAGRPWFEALAGDAVRFVLREVSDPKGLLKHRDPSAAMPAAPALPEGLDPQTLADAISGVIRRSYANWADEPIPALGSQTPRQAMHSASGLERVKGLLRSYESGEAQAAAQQGRPAVSYQFLWDALGLTR